MDENAAPNLTRVLVESPFADIREAEADRNIAYMQAAMADCFARGEAPFASHGLYTQPGVLDDTKPDQRKLGIEAGLQWGAYAQKTVVYVDRGISAGMKLGIERALKEHRPIEFRTLGNSWVWDEKTAGVYEYLFNVILKTDISAHEEWV